MTSTSSPPAVWPYIFGARPEELEPVLKSIGPAVLAVLNRTAVLNPTAVLSFRLRGLDPVAPGQSHSHGTFRPVPSTPTRPTRDHSEEPPLHEEYFRECTV